MVTERGSILNQTVLSEKIQKRYLRTLFIVALICLVIGAVGVVAYIAVGVTMEMNFGETPAWCEALLVFAVPFAFGLIFVLTVNSLIRQARKNSGVINEYEFFSDCLMAREIRGGEVCANVCINYNQIVKTKQVGEYFFFFYQVKTLSYPIDTTDLTEAELNTIKNLFGASVPEGAETVELSPSAVREQAEGQEISSK